MGLLPGVFVLDRALRMPSGVMSTRDRMLAKAGLEGVALEAADWPDGVVGVPGDGRAGLAAKKIKRQTERGGFKGPPYKSLKCLYYKEICSINNLNYSKLCCTEVKITLLSSKL